MSFPANRSFAAAVLLLALAGTAPVAARAAEFVPGGYASALTGGAALEADAPVTDPAAGEASAVLFDFTPRGAGLPTLGGGEDAPRLRFELDAGPDGDGAGLDALGLGGSAGPSWLDEGIAAGPRRLSLGGALVWSGWSVGGGLARTDLAGGAADLVSATVGYGPLSTSLAFGQAGGGSGQQQSRGVLMLSTDLSAWSWLTLESDVALGDSADGDAAESVAVGRLGVRLNF